MDKSYSIDNFEFKPVKVCKKEPGIYGIEYQVKDSGIDVGTFYNYSHFNKNEKDLFQLNDKDEFVSLVYKDLTAEELTGEIEKISIFEEYFSLVHFTNKDSFEDSVKRRFERKSDIYVFAKNTEFEMNKDNKPFVKIFLPIGNSDEEKWGSVYINLNDKNQYRLINSRDAVIKDIKINKPKTVYFKNHTETWTIDNFLKAYDKIFENFITSEQEITVLENVPHDLINYEKGYLKIPVPDNLSVSGKAIVYPKRPISEGDTDIILGTKEGYVDCYLYKGNGESVHEKMKTTVIKEFFEDYLRDLEEDIDLT